MSNQESQRQPIAKSIRFEVLKRDKFTCQYCGRKAPDIVLQIDHITPVSKGGTNDLLNLITSCIDCNLGKSNRTLADTTIIDRKRSQMEELQERREQIEMMMEWQRSLVELDQYLVEQVAAFWSELAEPYSLTEHEMKSLKKLLRQYNPDEVMEAMRIATKQYLEYENDKPTQESVNQAWSKVGGICKLKKIEQTKPYMRDLFYIRGILRKRLRYVNEWLCIKLLEQAYQCGADVEKLKDHACKVRNWTQWREEIETFIQSAEEHDTNSEVQQEDAQNIEDYREVNSIENDKFTVTDTAASEIQQKIEAINKVFEMCDLYAKQRNYSKVAEICNKYLEPASEIEELLDTVDGWFIIIENGQFVVNYARLNEQFNNRYKHWRIDYARECIYTLDGGHEYWIGFETLQTDVQKQEWIKRISYKNWSSPQMLAELTQILESTFFVST